MNPQPTIFISSIISEFSDLRGALKYFLGKSGFRVLMSEEPDFGADCGMDSLDNCKSLIEKSDYYLLLIGNKPGTIFKANGEDTTVTFEEFKHYINIVQSGKQLNLISFVRQQTWDDYAHNDFSRIDRLQIELINELINNSLFEDAKIGRWRYTFSKFSDIITTLETNQNGLFLDSTRKTSIYRTYIKREITDIYKSLLEKSQKTEKVESITDLINLPKLDNLDLFQTSKIPMELAARIKVLLIVISKRDSFLRKINRVFTYVAQGEFARFDPIEEKYNLPEYIKLTIQTLEILEKIFDNANNTDSFDRIIKQNTDNFYLNGADYWIIESTYQDIRICMTKLSNLIRCFHENWYDLEKREDAFYEYRGGIKNITDAEALNYANNLFEN